VGDTGWLLPLSVLCSSDATGWRIKIAIDDRRLTCPGAYLQAGVTIN